MLHLQFLLEAFSKRIPELLLELVLAVALDERVVLLLESRLMSQMARLVSSPRLVREFVIGSQVLLVVV
jgi:hypothetical protein